MTLTASHRDLDLDVLEELSSGAHSVGTRVAGDSPEIAGCVVLATCNRFEVYVDTVSAEAVEPTEQVVAATIAAVARASGLPVAEVAAAMQTRTGAEVARHLFAVASGLDSMVVGEREVAGQVRRALQAARADGTTSPALERLFQSASSASRAVGSRTGLGSTGRSVVGVALEMVADELGRQGLELAAARVVLVGTGSYAGASLTALRARGVRDVAVHSPSGRARQFAAARGLEAIEPAELPAQLCRAEVVVCCSGALGPVIDAAMVADARARATGPGQRPRPSVLVDLALRHDIDPTVKDVPGVRLIDLAAVQRHSPATVTPAVEAGLRIVEERAVAFERSLVEQGLVPAVVALRDHVEQAVAAEVARVRRGGADDAAAAVVERSLRRFAASVLHTPAVRAREHARDGRHAEYRAGLQAVFGIEVPDASGRGQVPVPGASAAGVADLPVLEALAATAADARAPGAVPPISAETPRDSPAPADAPRPVSNRGETSPVPHRPVRAARVPGGPVPHVVRP